MMIVLVMSWQVDLSLLAQSIKADPIPPVREWTPEFAKAFVFLGADKHEMPIFREGLICIDRHF